MNVFEDLIVELKQENLLEDSVIDDHLSVLDTTHLEDTAVPNAAESMDFERFDGSDTTLEINTIELDGYDSHLEDTVAPPLKPLESQTHKKPRNGQDFYRKRAMAEVSNLQMVEHVLTGVEREYMKVVPKIFDDFEAKKALNTFLQVTENENSNEHKEAEFRLMTETEAWCTGLSDRDKDISVANLRQYCESSRPPLSSQALVALGRFYRNLPYSESVRSKFDFVITRLFSRATENELRIALFNREEMLVHIHTLYRDWSSIALYGAEEDDSNISLAALSFEDLAIEAENAGGFDALVEKDFFGRVRTFKESIGELFYAPSVLAAAIDANVRIGNAYVRLIEMERRKQDSESIHAKYGDLYDDSVSEGIGRTLELVDLLRMPLERSQPVEEEETGEQTNGSVPDATAKANALAAAKERHPFVERVLQSVFGMNKWLVGASLLLIAASFGIYIYANYFVVETTKKDDVRQMTISDPLYKDFVTTGRITDQTFYGLLMPTWDTLPKEKKTEILTKIYTSGKENGFVQVNLIGADGKPAGFASANRLEIFQK